MSITEIPRAFLYKCDVCGAEHIQEGASGYYTNSRPPHWAMLRIEQTAYDYQGAACADGTIERLLCDACRGEAIKVINKWATRKMKV